MNWMQWYVAGWIALDLFCSVFRTIANRSTTSGRAAVSIVMDVVQISVLTFMLHEGGFW